jgi:hypothetical protein
MLRLSSGLALLLSIACTAGAPRAVPDSGTPDSGTPDGGTPDSGTPDSGTPDSGTPDSGTPDSGTPDGGGCIGADLLNAFGKHTILVGASMTDDTAKAAAWDVRYQYIASHLADGAGPCQSCATNCTSGGVSCANASGGCSWWGCWQWDQVPPGSFATDYIGFAHDHGMNAMFTLYMILPASGVAEGAPEVTQAARDTAFMTRYFADFRFLLQRIGTARALLQIEPDFWGYAQHANSDPHQLQAAVASANATDCADQEDSIAGLGKGFIAMTRKYAPNALVGLHASPWGTGVDVLINTDANLDVAAEGRKLAAFLVACGADRGDFVTLDASDRDAAWYATQGQPYRWWDATNATLPDFHQAFTWAKSVAEGVGKPVVFWQIPVGNDAQTNTTDHWKDNRVDYFFGHTNELAAAHVAGIFFGAGASGQTTPESDGGNLLAKAKAYLAAGGQALCQ